MGKGSPRKTLRFPGGLLAQIELYLGRRNAHYRRQEPRSVSALIVQAVKEKLAHLDRAGRNRKGPRMVT